MIGIASNTPPPGALYLDHVGHFVADPDECAAALRSVGFTVTPFSAQITPDPATGRPVLTGTGNVCVMLRSGYLEFLAHTADTPIGREFREALARRAGLHLAAFSVADAAAVHARLEANGVPMRPLVRMSREIATGSGSAEARFTVARLAKGVMPEGRIQFLTHGNEAALWQERWLDHPNGATGLVSMLVSAPEPAEAAARFSAVLDRPSVRTRSGSFRVVLDRGEVEILEEASATALIGMEVDPGACAIVGYRMSVRHLPQTLDFLAGAGISVGGEDGDAVVRFPPALGSGAWVFHQPGHRSARTAE